MKLRNKKTGEVFDALVRERGGGGSYSLVVCELKAYEHSKSSLDATHFILDEYESLAELNAEWEDCEEQKEEDWYINEDNEPQRVCFGFPIEDMVNLKEIGLLFKTKEETEEAIKKLKAWKRLKDKGFRFAGYGRYHWTGEEWPHIAFSYPNFDDLFDDEQTVEDLDLLFGEEEE